MFAAWTGTTGATLLENSPCLLHGLTGWVTGTTRATMLEDSPCLLHGLTGWVTGTTRATMLENSPCLLHGLRQHRVRTDGRSATTSNQPSATVFAAIPPQWSGAPQQALPTRLRLRLRRRLGLGLLEPGGGWGRIPCAVGRRRPRRPRSRPAR